MLTSTWISSLDEIAPQEWNGLHGAAHPFLRHEFLSALEHSGCTGPESGWIPSHLTVRDRQGRLVGAMPLYRKLHSWGEFVFDFAWARAYAQHGLDYYPKLVCAVPFTPATGPRLLTDRTDVRQTMIASARERALAEGLSSLHILFPAYAEAQDSGFLLRRGCQFHWHNRGYADFDHFLASFTAEKRKKVRRERRRIAEAGLAFRTLTGGDIDQALWERIYAFHVETFLRHGHMPYLNRAFFEEISARLPRQIVVQLAEHRGRPVAAAICFRSDDTLYGRYWGASESFHGLHFETCYYQGIEYCIRHGLQRFEPGTQGEHKISRGFIPEYTWSAHWLADERFQAALGHYLEEEGEAVMDYAADMAEHVPYKLEAQCP